MFAILKSEIHKFGKPWSLPFYLFYILKSRAVPMLYDFFLAIKNVWTVQYQVQVIEINDKINNDKKIDKNCLMTKNFNREYVETNCKKQNEKFRL